MSCPNNVFQELLNIILEIIVGYGLSHIDTVTGKVAYSKAVAFGVSGICLSISSCGRVRIVLYIAVYLIHINCIDRQLHSACKKFFISTYLCGIWLPMGDWSPLGFWLSMGCLVLSSHEFPLHLVSSLQSWFLPDLASSCSGLLDVCVRHSTDWLLHGGRSISTPLSSR